MLWLSAAPALTDVPIALHAIRASRTREQSARLGNTAGGIDDIAKHRWFSSFDWEGLLERRLEPPFKPVVSSVEDTSNFQQYPAQDDSAVVSHSSVPLTPTCHAMAGY